MNQVIQSEIMSSTRKTSSDGGTNVKLCKQQLVNDKSEIADVSERTGSLRGRRKSDRDRAASRSKNNSGETRSMSILIYLGIWDL